jgi:hypothetical protein
MSLPTSQLSRLLRAAVALGAIGITLTGCEVLVNLDRGEVHEALPDGCAICTDIDSSADAPDNETLDAGGDASTEAQAAVADTGGSAVDGSSQ